MKTNLLLIALCFCSVQIFYAQEDGVVSLALPVRNSLTFNQYVLNPTFSFVREQNQYISIYNKREWVQFEDAPQTYLVSYSGRFKENIGAGVGLFQQNYGVLTTFGGILNFAYNARLDRDSNLTFGLNVGAYKSGINTGNVVTNFPDPSLDNVPSNFLLTVNPGINYGTAFLDFGLSVNNLVLYNINSSELIKDNPQQSFQAHLMYNGYMDSRGFFDESKFSGLVRSEFGKEETIISGLVMLTVPKGIWAQVGYNTVYGASGGLGINITPQIAIEYNFEKALGDLTDFGPSHDITLAYKFNTRNNYDYGNEDELGSIISLDKKRKPVTKVAQIDAAKRAELAAEAKLKAEATAKAKAEAEANKIADTEEKAKLAQEVKAKADKEAKAKAEAQTKIEQDAIAAQEKLAAQKLAVEVAQAKAKLAREAKAKADIEAKAKAEAEARLAEAVKVKAEREAQAKIEAEAKAIAEAKAKVEVEAQAKLAAEKLEIEAAEAKAKAVTEAKAKADAEAKAIAEAQAQAKIDAENKAKAEAEQKALAEAEEKAKKEAAAKLVTEAQAKLDAEALIAAKEKEQLAAVPTDKIAMSMKTLTDSTEDSQVKQTQLLTRLSEVVADKDRDLKDLKEENDLGDQGIFMEPKPFKSVTAENNAIEALKVDLDEVIKIRNARIEELEDLYEQRLRIATIVNDTVNLYYQKAIKKLKAEQLKAIASKAKLEATLADIQVATEIERKRRIKRALYNNEEDRYAIDKATLNAIKQNTPVSSKPFKAEDFDFGEEQSGNIQILKNVKNVDNGFYLIVAVHDDVTKRDDFVTKVVASGRTTIDFFYDVNTSKYYIYYEKFDNIEQANEALKLKGNRPYNGKISLVKIEN